jgi:hypothetical protein
MKIAILGVTIHPNPPVIWTEQYWKNFLICTNILRSSGRI